MVSISLVAACRLSLGSMLYWYCSREVSSEVVYVLVRRISLSTLVWYYSVPNFLLMIFFRSFVSDLLCRFEKKVFFSEVLAHRILRYAFLASLLAYDLEKCEHASRMRAISCEETRKNASLASARMAPFCARVASSHASKYAPTPLVFL